MTTRIGLKSYKEHKELSEETTAYTTKLTLDGKVVGDAKNEGQGGSDRIWVDPAHRAAWDEALAGANPEEVIEGLVKASKDAKAVARIFKKDPRITRVVAVECDPMTIGDETIYGAVEFRGYAMASDDEIKNIIDSVYGADAPRTVFTRTGDKV